MQKAFSLVELSIVLVILGLLTGGILAGQSLIRAAELRSLSADVQRYKAASQTFRDKYFSLPGDIANASRFWLRQINAAHCVTTSSAAVGTPGVCDGNGNGLVEQPAAGSESGESFQVWRHLANAGLIEGSYTGLSGSAGLQDSTVGANIPATKFGNVGCYIHYTDASTLGAGSTYYSLNYKNVLTCGSKIAYNDGPFLKPEEAWNIDTKMDDGIPGRGFVMAAYIATCTTAANALDFSGQYALNNSSTTCALRFLDFF
jgi:prepilin-type N-terminal cleavage/methylation domain-containing protein